MVTNNLRDAAKRRQRCAYCNKIASTQDHIPPKRLFTPPLPDNLITVPACAKCNQGFSNDDEVFRNELTIMAGSFGESAKAAERLAPTMRGIRRNKATLRKMVLGATPVERYSPGGVYLGLGYAVPVNSEARRRVLVRVVRGLYWHHFEGYLGDDIQIKLEFIDKGKPDWKKALSSSQRLNPKHVLVGDGDTFQYLYGKAADNPTFSFWLLIFFKGSTEQIILAITDTIKVQPV